MLRKGDWKLIEALDPKSIELYNLKTDLGETKNLADVEQEKLAELQKELNDWRESVGAEKMEPNPDFQN